MNQTPGASEVLSKPKEIVLFERANAEYDAGRYESALRLFDDAIACGLKSEVVYNNKGTTLDAMGRYREAAKCYKKAVSMKSTYELAWHNLGNCYYVQELYVEATEAYAKAAKLNPKRKENWSGLAAACSRSSRRKRAAKAVEKLGSFAVDDKSILLLQSDLYMDCGLPQKAIERCEAFIEAKPESPVGYARLGSVAHELGEYNRAIFAFSRALKISPNDKEIWNNLGYTCFSRGYLERAHECFDKAIALDPNYKHAWYNKGYAYHGADMLEEAVRCYKRAIAIDPLDKVLWNNLGNALYNLGRYVESIPKFVTALKVDPDYEIAWNNIGNALEKIGAFKQAIPYHDRSLEINSQFDYAIYAKGVCRSKIGLLEDGYDLIIESLDINPGYDEAWKARASVASQLGRWDEALMAVEQSLLLNPDFDQGWTQRGEILLATGDEEGAQASFEMALKCLEKVGPITSSGMMALVRRGDLLARLGKFEEALMNFETVAITRKMDFLSIPKALSMCRIMGRLELPRSLAEAVEASSDITSKVEYADFLLDKGDYPTAKKVVLSVSDSRIAKDMLLARARTRALMGDGEGAKTLLAWEREPSGDGVLHRLMGELLESRGDYAGAEKIYRRRAMKHPSDFSATVALSRIQLRLKDYHKAIRSADMAIGIDDRDWEPHRIKADAYAALGDGERSRTEAAQASAKLALVGMKVEDFEPKVSA